MQVINKLPNMMEAEDMYQTYKNDSSVGSNMK